MMMIANLIGFCVGLDGIVDLLKGILGSYQGTTPICLALPFRFCWVLTWVGWAFAAAVVASLFIGTQVMFEIREDEKRRGINLRC
jgi:D-alanyl-lipoteichoic acid acyltransferase DltB (MBOAT superfamily)